MKLVERDRELSIMENMLNACGAGHGGVISVSGAVASGKTALLRAFGERAVQTGALFLQATASRAQRGSQLGVVGQLLRGAELPEADAELAARLLQLAAVTAPVRGAEGAIPSEVSIDVIPRLCGILLAQARARPVVLSIDDVHHADAHSLECVLYVTRRLEVSPILVVLTESSSFSPRTSGFRNELLPRANCRRTRLGPLSWQGVSEMIAADRKGRGARPLVSDFHRLGGGSPLLTRALLEDFHASFRTGTAELVPGEAFEQAVTTCLYRSDVSTRRAAWALAVLGPDSSPAELADVLGGTPESAGQSLDALRDMGLLSTGWFRHEVGRSAVLQSMELPHRARLEARVARVLHDHGETATVVARHLIVAEPIDAPWTLPTLLEAARSVLDEDEAGLALDCLRVAEDTCTDGRQALAISSLLLRAVWRINPGDAARYLPELTDAALAGSLGVDDSTALVGYLLWSGQVDRALDVLAALGRRGGAASGVVRGHEAAAQHRAACGAEPQDGAAHGEAEPGRAVPGGAPPDMRLVRFWTAYAFPGLVGSPWADAADVPEQGPDAPESAERQAVILLSAVLGGRRLDGGVMARAERLLRDTRLDDRTLTAIMAALSSLIFADGLDKAAFWCDILLREATERRAPMWQALFASAKAHIEIRLGRLAEAEESARTALTLVSPEGWGTAVASPIATLLYAKVAMGRLDEAAAHLSIPVPPAAFHTTGGLMYLWARGQYYLAAKRPYAALHDFHACGNLMAKWEFDLPALVPWRTGAAQAYLVLGDHSRARDLLEEQLVRIGTGWPWVRGVSLRVLAAVAGVVQRPRLLGEAVQILRERGHRFELARATKELARAHRDLGDEGRARTLARRAQQLLKESGVESLVEDTPVAGTAGPVLFNQQSWPPGTDWRPVELSEAELRVAILAARGHTNRRIADKLFITISTVEQHLTRVYRKLDVQRRTDLASKLALDVTDTDGAEDGEPEDHDDSEVHDCLRAG